MERCVRSPIGGLTGQNVQQELCACNPMHTSTGAALTRHCAESVTEWTSGTARRCPARLDV